jgi:hypothetical protein
MGTKPSLVYTVNTIPLDFRAPNFILTTTKLYVIQAFLLLIRLKLEDVNAFEFRQWHLSRIEIFEVSFGYLDNCQVSS